MAVDVDLHMCVCSCILECKVPTPMVDFSHLHMYTNANTHTLACMHTNDSKSLAQWAAHRRRAFLYTLLPNAAYTHTGSHTAALLAAPAAAVV